MVGKTEIRDRPRFSFGFTLIELLVVMTIVALLLTLALPRYFGSIDKSKEAAQKAYDDALKAAKDLMDKSKSEPPKKN